MTVEDLAARIAVIAKTPGWGAWARRWARDLDDQGGPWTGIYDLVKKIIEDAEKSV
jgi:hypothetical protein